MIEQHKSDKKLSDYEKREIERTEKILKIVEQDQSDGKSVDTFNLLRQMEQDKLRKEREQEWSEKAAQYDSYVTEWLQGIYHSAE